MSIPFNIVYLEGLYETVNKLWLYLKVTEPFHLYYMKYNRKDELHDRIELESSSRQHLFCNNIVLGVFKK